LSCGLPVNAIENSSRNYVYWCLFYIYFWKDLCYWICLSALLNRKPMFRSNDSFNKIWQKLTFGTALLWRQPCGSFSIKLVSQYFVFCMQGKWCPEWGATTVLREVCFFKPWNGKGLLLIQLGTTGTRCLWKNESKIFRTCPILMLWPFTFFPFHSDASFFCIHYGPFTFLLTDSTQRAIACTFIFSSTQGSRKILLIFLIHFTSPSSTFQRHS
jgi:hypothetical protein